MKEQGFRASLIVKHCGEKCHQNKRKTQCRRILVKDGLQLPAQALSSPGYPWNHQQHRPTTAQLRPAALWDLAEDGVPLGKSQELQVWDIIFWRMCLIGCHRAALFIRTIAVHETVLDWRVLHNVSLPRLTPFAIRFPCGVTRT